MSDIYRNGRFEPDTWRALGADEALPAAGGVLLSLPRFIAERDAVLGSEAPFGLIVEPGDKLEAVGEDAGRFAVVAVRFPKFADGRGYSHARLLRDRYCFKGELRAIGDVLLDQVPYMLRIGFDTLEVTHGPTRARLEAGQLPLVPYFYQPSTTDAAGPAEGRPWRRRAF
ncbi:DUF934 domain-containing protein [Methyloraptor flagellatus]|uniref:DUF934 domain-containing protein n=1 Tax=Methyloraptor flagellatus TaxID=3162530 RepID=A0AAU7XA76_9HYPH